MNIGIDIRELSSGSTGISQFTLNLINYIIKTDKTNQYFLFTTKKFFLKNTSDSLKIVVYEKIKNNTLFELFVLPFLIKKYNIELFFSPYYKLPFFSFVPCIITVHDIGFITFPLEYYGRTGFYRFFAKFYLYFSLIKSKKIIAVSNYTKNEIIKKYKVKESKISILYNSINEVFCNDIQKQVEPDTAEAVRNYGDFVLSVSNYKPHKNIKNLVAAFSIIRSKTKLNLVLAGPKNKWRDEVKEYINDCGINDRIFFVTPAGNNELKLLYSSARMLVHPSLHEGFGLPPVEAQACGTPVISSDRTSLKEILNDACLYFNPESAEDIGNKILKLNDNESLRNELIDKGFENVKRFYPEQSYYELYDILCSSVEKF
ncbi:glycosyltransferase family 4 protein [Candidatus Dependentiae bacterium]|nr:glycosyltransferase family 4 protein [Candidatus Dependentiae bacterium]